jgi:hypothetical protein
MTSENDVARMVGDEQPEGQEAAIGSKAGDEVRLRGGGQAHLDMGQVAREATFGRPMSPDEGEDVHSGECVV